MYRVEKISSLDGSSLAPYRTLRRAAEHVAQGIFVAEGDKVVRRLLQSQFEVISVLLPEDRLEEFSPLLAARPEAEIEVFAVTQKSVLEDLVGFEMFQGVLAVGRIPKAWTLEGLLTRRIEAGSGVLLAAVDGLTSAENIGLLVRNCAAFGVHGLVVGETSSSPYLRRAVRNSMGAIFQLPVVELGVAVGKSNAAHPHSHPDEKPEANGNDRLAGALIGLRKMGVRCVAAHPHAMGKTLADAKLSGDCCIVFGSEGNGLSRQVLEACDEAVAIPMADGVDSLNVAATAAVFFYEASRQRR